MNASSPIAKTFIIEIIPVHMLTVHMTHDHSHDDAWLVLTRQIMAIRRQAII